MLALLGVCAGTSVRFGLGTLVRLGLGTSIGLGLETSVGLGLGSSVGFVLVTLYIRWAWTWNFSLAWTRHINWTLT